MESWFEEDECHVLQGQRSGKDPADQLVCLPAITGISSWKAWMRLGWQFHFSGEMWLFARAGDLLKCRGQVAGRGSCQSGDRSQISVFPAQRASSHLTAELLMSCRAREAVFPISWSLWYVAITFTDLPSTQIKMKFPLTGEHRSQKEVKVFMFIFPFGCYFGSPLLLVLI